ncbi:MAG: UDP-N-acetylglucosamine 2-epimerase (hydrolyzing) [Ruminococcus sp.]|nr:UDP-N-acetylglucosamine 2-epimerase (hydrolyzing) [Ruminococcus sp.]
MNRKKVVFLTGTRADYGKMKPLMLALEKNDNFDVYIFICGMHLLEKFGSTYMEVLKDGYKNIYVAYGLSQTQDSSVNLGNTITHLSGYVDNIKPDMIVVHGDRMDALAGAVVGALHNVIVAHIEGGELSGTIDESIRHAISKFAHIHFVCNNEAKNRLIQLGEEKNRIFVIGSPDIDVMMSNNLPTMEVVRDKYNIMFDNYGILMYHPVTTEYDVVDINIKAVVDAVMDSGKKMVVVYPNNDLGSEIILKEYKRLNDNPNFLVFPSLRFECFLTLLKNSDFIIGNSSAGIRESGIYGVPAIDIGTRQSGRYSTSGVTNIQHVFEDVDSILEAINRVKEYHISDFSYGEGNSVEKFIDIVTPNEFWNIEIQKRFVDYDM